MGREGIFVRFDLEIGGEREPVLRIKYLIIGNYRPIILTRIVNVNFCKSSFTRC